MRSSELIKKTSAFQRGLLFSLALLLFIAIGCGKEKAPEKTAVVSERVKIELPADMQDAPAKEKASTTTKKTKPKVSWVSPKKTTTKRKTTTRPKTVRKKATTTAKATVTKTTAAKTTTTKTAAKGDRTGKKPYVINLHSFVVKSEADILKRKVTQDGYYAYVTGTIVKGKMWYRLRIGFYDSETKAKEVLAVVKKKYNAKGAWHTTPKWAEIEKYRK